MSKQFHGIIAYPITPIKDDDTLDLRALGASIEKLVGYGVHAVAPLGSTGESAYLSEAEWEQVAETSVKTVAQRVPTIVGISDLTTAKAVRRAKFAEQVGADAVMVLPISYWKLNEAEIFKHFAAIAESISLPIMLYNNPATSGIDMQPALIAKIVREIDNVTMVKESTGDIQRMHKLHALSDGAIAFYNGSNTLAFEALAVGAKGWCTAAPNLIPELNLGFFDAMAKGDLARGRALFFQQLPLLEFIMAGGLPTTIKAGLKLMGLDAGRPRKPLEPLSQEGIAKLQAMLTRLASRTELQTAAE